jgi:hypothetical protein
MCVCACVCVLKPCVCAADVDLPRYKIIVQVVLGEMKNQGARVASRCLWDTDTDNYASVSFKNVRARRAVRVCVCLCLPTRVRVCVGLLNARSWTCLAACAGQAVVRRNGVRVLHRIDSPPPPQQRSNVYILTWFTPQTSPLLRGTARQTAAAPG